MHQRFQKNILTKGMAHAYEHTAEISEQYRGSELYFRMQDWIQDFKRARAIRMPVTNDIVYQRSLQRRTDLLVDNNYHRPSLIPKERCISGRR
jgi:YHS domain-containing protein